MFIIFRIFKEQLFSYLRSSPNPHGWHVLPYFFILNSFPCNSSLINEWKQLNPMVFMCKLNFMSL